MIITSIEQQKNNKNRYSIFIDDEYYFGLDGVDVLYYKLKENESISQQMLDNIIENNVYIKAKNRALKFLTYKGRSEREIRKKLQENDYSNKIIDKVVAFLKEYNYVNDIIYAENYISDRVNNNSYGLIRIKLELKMKGINQEIIDDIIEELDINEVENAVSLINDKVDCIEEVDHKEKKRIFDFLMRKGYSYTIIKDAFSEVGL